MGGLVEMNSGFWFCDTIPTYLFMLDTRQMHFVQENEGNMMSLVKSWNIDDRGTQ